MIDYRDIGETEIIKLVNEKALMHENDYVKEAYLYDYLIQIDLTTVNGLTCKNTDDKDKLTIANVFFRFQFEDLESLILTSDQQKIIVDEIF